MKQNQNKGHEKNSEAKKSNSAKTFVSSTNANFTVDVQAPINKKIKRGRRLVKIKQYIQKWSDPMVIVTVLLTFATLALYIEATNQKTELTNEFKAESRAFLQIDDITLNRDSLLRKNLSLGIYLSDFGKSPARILYIKFTISTGSDDVINEISNNQQRYVSGIANIHYDYNANPPDTLKLKQVIIGKRSIFIKGEFKYFSMMTSKTYLSKFMFKVSVYPWLDVEDLINNEQEVSN